MSPSDTARHTTARADGGSTGKYIMALNTEAKTAEKLGLARRSLQRYRQDGCGPKFVRLGQRRIAYTDEAIENWLAKRTFTSTAAENLARSP
jgi:predicted DNA-binding transcriptional regulator AlpA